MEYIDAFYNALLNILPFTSQGQQAFFFMLVGIFIGFWVGILPGLGGAATLALMLPFIYKMDPTSAFAFLLGSNAVTATTGDITSILFGVPGEGTTASTIVDGHPMAKKGEAGRALGAALMSSLVGAIFGAFVLAAAIPIAAPLVLSIGSPEFFMLALLGYHLRWFSQRRQHRQGSDGRGPWADDFHHRPGSDTGRAALYF